MQVQYTHIDNILNSTVIIEFMSSESVTANYYDRSYVRNLNYVYDCISKYIIYRGSGPASVSLVGPDLLILIN